MKRGTPDHPKTLRLARRLDVWPVTAVGLLECLWHWATKYRPAGDIGRGHDAADIEMGCKWRGKPGLCVEAMIAERWIDDLDGLLVVHDWSEHADEAVHRALARDRKFFADGKIPRLSGLGREERPAAAAFYAAAGPQGGHDVATSRPLDGDGGSLPRRAPPCPAPPDTTDLPSPPAADAAGGPSRRAQLERDRASLVAYWIQIGGHPNRKDRRQVWELLQRGRSPAHIRGSIAERVREDLIRAGKLDSGAEWPPGPTPATEEEARAVAIAHLGPPEPRSQPP